MLIRVFGLCFVVAGLAARFGFWKSIHWRSRGAVYGYIPLGLLFILYSFSDRAAAWPQSYYVLYQAGNVLFILIGVWWSVSPPGWVKPTWIRWMEEYPESVHEEMVRAAEQGGDWESHLESQEAMEAWVKNLLGGRRRLKKS